ncbi:ATP-binding protein [Methanosarcina sp.]|uniref:ATP-binding protein n=1 Tax=Methanosarcina sp. TaxID=2213 RepID=UPI003BB5E025
MQKFELLPLLQDHQTFFQNSSDLIPRISLPYFIGGRGITFISGPIHAGKTSLLRQIASNLQGAKIYIDFEDNRIQGSGPESFQVIEEIAEEICKKEPEKNEAGQIYYFLDEVQKVPGWESWVDGLYRQGAGIFITSSSSNLNGGEFSSRFADECKVLKLLPFSFKEYLLLKGARIPKPNFLTPSRCDEMLCMFLQYFENGGFPAVIKNGDIRFAQKYFEEILQKGSASGYGIQDASGLKKLAIFLISNMALEYSFDTLKKVSGIEDEEIIRHYMDYLEDIFLLYRVPKLNHLPDSEGKMDIPCKIYSGDTGFFKAVYPNYPDNLGLRFENLVFLEMLRREKQIFYFQGQRECDFLIKESDSQKVSAAIQVSIYFGSPASREREIMGLMEVMEEYGLEEGLILTMDDEETLEFEGKDGKKQIIVKSVWRWMLE